MTTTSSTYTSVFFVPMTDRMTSMFGSDSAGPASSSASAGPVPMPAPSRPWRMGTSGGRHPVTPWGKPTIGYRTRKKSKSSDRYIVRGRRRGKKKGR